MLDHCPAPAACRQQHARSMPECKRLLRRHWFARLTCQRWPGARPRNLRGAFSCQRPSGCLPDFKDAKRRSVALYVRGVHCVPKPGTTLVLQETHFEHQATTGKEGSSRAREYHNQCAPSFACSALSTTLSLHRSRPRLPRAAMNLVERKHTEH